MTRWELEQLHDLAREVRLLPEQIAQIEAIAYGVTARITGMPRSGRVGDKVGESAIKLAMLDNKLQRQREKYQAEIIRLTEFLDTVDDAEVRSIIRERCALGKEWQEVADALGLGSESTVRMKYVRYWDRLNDMCAGNVVI